MKIVSRSLPTYVPAGLAWRVLAQIIDAFVILLFSIPLQIACKYGYEWTDNPLYVEVFPWMLWVLVLYYGIVFCTKRGGTPGKMVLSLRVVDAETGLRPTLQQALFREGPGKILSTLPVLSGYFLASLRKDRRTLHDLMGGTVVLRRTT